ncbi:SseB family protein [Oceaniglobus ichthyenteri]|uniref:SseB family protein n=1 Tax=Oceaniglobus ichthyenteri TaxID=2136177 RepID=UPI000D370DA2|nr:SseB family protein [Oceaniglobus ichthyenteri]
MTQTPLDHAHAAMEAGGDSERLAFYERLADGELFMMLDAEPEGDQIAPAIFDTGEGRFVLVFDREARLAQFAGQITPYAALSGRVIAAMLAGQGLGLALNPDVAPSSFLVPADGIAWLAETLAETPNEVEARPREITVPHGLPEVLLRALDAKLATASGMARMAYLVGAQYETTSSHLLAFIDPAPGAEPALARATGEALTFSGIEAGVLDVGFFSASDPFAARLARVGLRFDLPEVEISSTPGANPGMDPAKPPKLR